MITTDSPVPNPDVFWVRGGPLAWPTGERTNSFGVRGSIVGLHAKFGRKAWTETPLASHETISTVPQTDCGAL